MMILTDDHRTRLAGYGDTSKILALKTWRAQGFDVSEYQDLLPSPKPAPAKVYGEKRSKTAAPKKPCKCEVSNVGTLLKKSLEWTGIPTCQRCSALANELNTRTPGEVLRDIDKYAARLLENLKALSKGEAEGLTWWQTQSAKAKATVALAVLGEESAFAYARAYIVKACESATCTSGQCGVAVPESLVPGGDHVVEGASGVLVPDGGGVESVVRRAESLSEQGDANAEAQPHGNAENVVDDGAEKSHARGPGDGSGPIHNEGLSLSDHENFDNPEEKVMGPPDPGAEGD